ncbi:MAG TPA: protein kinase [Thermoanaerobaculia bacterium]|jgi:Tol biopolymer transport system component/predicted Ser/Thr protein kinase|nr:protein kinase [Thermoanaerobaculia bacterium]
MPLSPGTRLGPYEIVSPLGAGGMGEVYRARDTRLGREVAVKVLLPEVSGDESRRIRFEQEARSASALNHPNIVAVYDVGSVDSTVYLAMELVEGRTLREMLADGALPSRKMLEVAVQVAEGLAKAHEAGLVHRDLKPENLIVSKDGFVKILDFGLAKLTEPTSSDGLSALQTIAGAPGTVPGTVMGTVGYMSPEQASGRDVDFRSDQFSFGSILYELATGKRAFQRNTGAETLTAIIREDPQPLGQVNPRVPAPVRWIVERCLAKEPEERFASTKDLARDLRSLRDHLSETSASETIAAAAPAHRKVPAWAATAAALIVGLALGVGGVKLLAGARPSSNAAPQRLTFRHGTIVSARFAPDGRSVVYAAAWDGKPIALYTTRAESPESRALGLPPASLLSVSPAGDLAVSLGWRPIIGWETLGTLARVSLEGGAPREILEDVMDADWSPDGKELAVVRETGPTRRLEFPIGKRLHDSVGWISNPRVSPDGKLVAVIDHPQRGDNLGRVLVFDADGKKRLDGPPAVTGLAWSRDGKEVWFTGNNLSAVTLSGKVREVANFMGFATLHDVSRDGRALVSRNTWRREIVGLAPGETAERNLTWLDWSFPTALSDDGKRVLFDEQNLPSYLAYLRETDGSPAVLLGQYHSIDLSPDGKWALVTDQDGREMTLLPTGAGQPHKLPGSGLTNQGGAFFPDGRRILSVGSEPGRGTRLWVQDVNGSKPRPITPEGVSLQVARPISPDGKTITAQGPDRRFMLYPSEPGEPRPVPGIQNGEVPIRWTADGRAIWVYRTNEVPAKVYRLDVTTGERSLWKELTPPDPAGVLLIGPIFMTPDGKSYVYSYRRTLDELFLVEGLK